MEKEIKNLEAENRQAHLEEDSNLVLMSQGGDRQAFNKLMLKYHRRIFNAVYRILGDYSDADDVAQDVFVRAYRGIGGFKQESNFLTWLYAIAVNLSRNKMKKNCRDSRGHICLDEPVNGAEGDMKREIPDPKAKAPDKAVIDKEKDMLVQAAIQALEEDFRAAVVLRDIQQISYEEIGRILNINIGTVKSRIYRGRQILQETLKEVV